MDGISHQVMKPVYGGVVIVWQPLTHGSRRESLLIFTYLGVYDRLSVILLLDSAQPPVIGDMREQLGALVRLLKIVRHALTAAGPPRVDARLDGQILAIAVPSFPISMTCIFVGLPPRKSVGPRH